MMVSWWPDKPVSCNEHGCLSDGLLPRLDGMILTAEHLRDTHDKDMSEFLGKLYARRVAAGVNLLASL